MLVTRHGRVRWGVTGIYWMQTRMLQTSHNAQDSPQQNYPATNVSSAKAENLHSSTSFRDIGLADLICGYILVPGVVVLALRSAQQISVE